MSGAPVKAVFFDVDFTLIYPGPTFQGEGYAQFCARHQIDVDPLRFAGAVLAASAILNDAQDHIYTADIFVRYTRRIIEEMGGAGERLDAAAREIYEEWAACQHFFLYDDVTPALRELAVRQIKVGLISRHTLEMNLNKIESVNVNQGILGRLLGYGTIIVVGTGGTKEPFDSISDPLRFRKEFQELSA